MTESKPPGTKRPIREALDTMQRMMNVIEDAGVTNVTLRFIRDIAKEYDLPPEDVMFKSLSLFRMAAEQETKGNHLAFLTPDDEIVTEVPGIREPFGLAEKVDA